MRDLVRLSRFIQYVEMAVHQCEAVVTLGKQVVLEDTTLETAIL